MPQDYQKTTLENGLRIIAVPEKTAKAVTVLVLVGAGSKYETKKENGISHFLEHMFFKGTQKRPNTLAIAEALDRVGGNYNAFTGKEYTGYFAKVAANNFDLALDWVSDIFLNSKIPPAEIEREKGVILEELNMYLDMPMKYVAELWEKLLYGDQPAGWETIGVRENIQSFKRGDFVNYLKNHYSSHNTIVCLSGNFQDNAIENAVSAFSKIQQAATLAKEKVKESQTKVGILLNAKKTDQTHFCLGARGYDLFHPKYYAQEILSIILGGNMSSRLFIKVRERKGLCYYIHTNAETYTDSGYLVTQAGVVNSAVETAIDLILKEYRDIKKKGVGEDELRKAKDYLKGSMILALESSDALASFYATQDLLRGEILTIEEKIKKVEAVSLEDIKEVADDIFQNNKLNLALIGPKVDKNKFLNILKI